MPVAIGRSVATGSGRTPAMNCVSASDPGVLAKIAPVPVRDTKKRPERLSTATPSGLASLVGAPGIVKTVVAAALLPRLPSLSRPPRPPPLSASATEPPAVRTPIANSPAIDRHACLMMW